MTGFDYLLCVIATILAIGALVKAAQGDLVFACVLIILALLIGWGGVSTSTG